jgi:chromosome segregation ATPase
MRKLLTILGILILTPALAFAQQDSVAEAARKARAKKGQQKAQPGKVYTNDNLPASGSVNVVGSAPQAAGGQAEQKEGEQPGEERGEEYWRAKFSEANKKLSDAEKELDVLQRELEVKRIQYYDDPLKTLHEELERKEVNEHRKKIEDKQAEVARLRQAISDLENELRRAGGSPGWARP